MNEQDMKAFEDKYGKKPSGLYQASSWEGKRLAFQAGLAHARKQQEERACRECNGLGCVVVCINHPAGGLADIEQPCPSCGGRVEEVE